MSDLIIKYLVNCPICGKDFYAKRKHANTCSARCRFILHQLNIGLKNYCDLIEIDLRKMNSEQIKGKAHYVRNTKMLDPYGNPFDFINGYIDNKGDIVRAIFRNSNLEYIKAWNLVDDEIEEKIFKYS